MASSLWYHLRLGGLTPGPGPSRHGEASWAHRLSRLAAGDLGLDSPTTGSTPAGPGPTPGPRGGKNLKPCSWMAGPPGARDRPARRSPIHVGGIRPEALMLKISDSEKLRASRVLCCRLCWPRMCLASHEKTKKTGMERSGPTPSEPAWRERQRRSTCCCCGTPPLLDCC